MAYTETDAFDFDPKTTEIFELNLPKQRRFTRQILPDIESPVSLYRDVIREMNVIFRDLDDGMDLKTVFISEEWRRFHGQLDPTTKGNLTKWFDRIGYCFLGTRLIKNSPEYKHTVGELRLLTPWEIAHRIGTNKHNIKPGLIILHGIQPREDLSDT